jgi:PhzF family phenazine biosynthesis protein
MLRLYHVDAFTNQIFKGNPAGVCILPLDKMQDNELLQNIAAEINLSETAFLSKLGPGYQLRWFSPETEVEFCGHATLSAAHILWETGSVSEQEEIQFDTLSGKLGARYKRNKIELDFPIVEVNEITSRKDINTALGIEPVFTGITGKRYFIEIQNYTMLKGMRPDFSKLKEIGRTAFCVTCKSDSPDFDFYSRFFAPAIGINEDPVTGSSHSSLAPYWSKKLGKNRLTGYQASKRGGILECELISKDRVLIRGSARTVFEINMKSDG